MAVAGAMAATAGALLLDPKKEGTALGHLDQRAPLSAVRRRAMQRRDRCAAAEARRTMARLGGRGNSCLIEPDVARRIVSHEWMLTSEIMVALA